MSTFNSADIAAFKGGVWVFCEQRQGTMMPTSFELISEGRKLADELGTKLYGILLGHNVEGIAKELGGYGADGVYVCDHPLLANYTTTCPSTRTSCASPPPWPPLPSTASRKMTAT